MPPRSENFGIIAGAHSENEFGKISGFVQPVVGSPTAKLRIPSRPGILAPPDEPRYIWIENARKKKRLSEEECGRKLCACREFRGVEGEEGRGGRGAHARTHARAV
jgi:hypothetical protein